MMTEVSCALSQSDPNLVLSAAFKLRITQRDLATLQEGGWLNDEVRIPCNEFTLKAKKSLLFRVINI